MATSFALLASLAIFAACALSAQAQGQWYTGRATNYGSLQDPWSIHTGSCGYGYLDATVKTGWDIAAISDQAPDFGGSCGRCYEIQCMPNKFKDNYGEQLDRNDACYDSSASVVVQVTDSCPCVYPTNAYSNKRWCCGDMYHFDMSTWAFEKLASTRYGVIGVRFRPVPCDHQPSKWAPLPSKVSPGYAPPKGWRSSDDRRPWSSGGSAPSS